MGASRIKGGSRMQPIHDAGLSSLSLRMTVEWRLLLEMRTTDAGDNGAMTFT